MERSDALAGHALVALPDRRVLLIGGGENPPSRDVWAWDAGAGWTAVQPMGIPRTRAGALALRDGRVLVVGGWIDQRRHRPSASAELWDPRTGRWHAAGQMARARLQPALFALEDGRVLVVGGEEKAYPCASVPEVWDPRTGRWSAGAALPRRCGRPAVSALDGDRILLTGGVRASPDELRQPVAEAHVYQVSSDRWTSAPQMLQARDGHAAGRVGSGVLVVGGNENEAAAELFDPRHWRWRAVAAGSAADGVPLVVPLVSGGALVVRETVQLWDDRQLALRSGAAPLASPGKTPRAVPLLDGRVFMTAPPLRFPVLWDPNGQAQGTWTAVPRPSRIHFFGTGTPLSGERVLLAGGEGPRRSEALAQMGDLRAKTWQPLPAMGTPRSYHTATALPGGDVLVAGGLDPSVGEEVRRGQVGLGAPRPSRSFLTAAEVWKGARGWTRTGDLAIARANHTASLLRDGRVLVAGGLHHQVRPAGATVVVPHGRRFIAETELWSPSTGGWQAGGPLRRARAYHTATVLTDGRVLVAGGTGVLDLAGPQDALAELWDPTAGRWQPAGTLKAPRYDHTATLLPDGRVLVAGGRQAGGGAGALASCEVWDPRTLTWSDAGQLNLPRYGHFAAITSGGAILVAGGFQDGSVLAAAGEVWHPHTGRWSPAPPLPARGSVAAMVGVGEQVLLVLPDAAMLFSR